MSHQSLSEGSFIVNSTGTSCSSSLSDCYIHHLVVLVSGAPPVPEPHTFLDRQGREETIWWSIKAHTRNCLPRRLVGRDLWVTVYSLVRLPTTDQSYKRMLLYMRRGSRIGVVRHLPFLRRLDRRDVRRGETRWTNLVSWPSLGFLG